MWRAREPEETTEWGAVKQQEFTQVDYTDSQPAGTQENTFLGIIHILCAEIYTQNSTYYLALPLGNINSWYSKSTEFCFFFHYNIKYKSHTVKYKLLPFKSSITIVFHESISNYENKCGDGGIYNLKIFGQRKSPLWLKQDGKWLHLLLENDFIMTTSLPTSFQSH